jgi:dihydrofolate reductase
MRPVRYSINVTLDGCCGHRAIPADEDLHRHAAEILSQADALLFGQVTYEMMESAWRPTPTGTRPDWMEPFAQTINAATKYVVSGTLERVDWNAELVRGDLGQAVQRLKEEPGKGLFVGGVPGLSAQTRRSGMTPPCGDRFARWRPSTDCNRTFGRTGAPMTRPRPSASSRRRFV